MTEVNLTIDGVKTKVEAGSSILQAADNIGHLLHYQGKVPEALPYLQASAERGEPRGQYFLATELFNGTQIQKDWVRAYALMTRASSAGLAPASRSLAEMDKYIPLEQRQKGVALAGEIETATAQKRAAQVTGFPINTKAPVAVAKPIDVPPSKTTKAVEPGFPGTIPDLNGEKTQPEPTKTAKKPTAVAGKWRIQLGAFGSEANAKKLWASLQQKVDGLSVATYSLVPAGNLSRLQAGPFANRSDAEAMCTKVKSAVAGQGCLIIAP